MAHSDFARRWQQHVGNKTKEIIRETEIIEEGEPEREPYGRMRIVKVGPRSEIVKEKRETFIETAAKICLDCMDYTNSDEAVAKCPKCGSTNVTGYEAGRPSRQWTLITRERELSEVASFIDKHHRFIASLKELSEDTSEKSKSR